MSSKRKSSNPVIQPGSIYEVRLFMRDGTVVSGYFDSERALYTAVKPYDGQVEGIYNTLNPVKPELLARAMNRLVIKATNLTKAPDILSRCWLFIDADVVRPKKEPKRSSTDAEHQAAHAKALDIKAYLFDIGWPDPVEADSGNGFHLVYRIDLPNDEDSHDVIRKILEYLANKFDDPTITIDRCVHEANRIVKLYGTMACKGENTAARPWRQSAVLDCPKQIQVVSVDALKRLAAMPLDTKKKTQKRTRKDDPLTRQYELSDVKAMLDVIPADDRSDWLNVGVILGREFPGSGEAWVMYVEWTEKWTGLKDSGHDKAMHTAFYVTSQQDTDKPLTMGTIVYKARQHGWIEDEVRELNAIHAVVMVEGRCAVMTEGDDPRRKGKTFALSGPNDLKLCYLNRRKQIGNRQVDLGTYWLKHPARRQYKVVVFAPEGTVPGYFNLWQGFAVEPKEGDCSRFLGHLYENIARKDEANYRYLLAWMANCVQHPADRPGTAVVLRGK